MACAKNFVSCWVFRECFHPRKRIKSLRSRPPPSSEISMSFLPANNDTPDLVPWSQNHKIFEWLSRLTQPGFSFNVLGDALAHHQKISVEQASGTPLFDDWQMVANICGH